MSEPRSRVGEVWRCKDRKRRDLVILIAGSPVMPLGYNENAHRYVYLAPKGPDPGFPCYVTEERLLEEWKRVS